jgi:hypothetical protein
VIENKIDLIMNNLFLISFEASSFFQLLGCRMDVQTALIAAIFGAFLGGSCALSEELSMVILGPPPRYIEPPPKPQWLHLDYDLECNGADGKLEQPHILMNYDD